MTFYRRPIYSVTMQQLKFLTGMRYFPTTASGCRKSSTSVTRKKRVTKTTETPGPPLSQAKDLSLPSNPFSIQILPSPVQRQLFGTNLSVRTSSESIQKSYDHLKKHNLYDKFAEIKPIALPKQLSVPLLLPAGNSSSIDQQVDSSRTSHETNIDIQFRAAASDISRPYCKELNCLLDAVANGSFPKMPAQWQTSSGWTRYNADGSCSKVAFPDEKCIVFDVEVAMTESNQPPTLATAISPTHWYSWCSGALAKRVNKPSKNATAGESHEKSESPDGVAILKLSDLIPLESGNLADNEPRLVIGHNVAFDRSYIREQYRIEPVSRTRFLDTMSLHIALAGFANPQRAVYMSSYKTTPAKESAAKKAAEKTAEKVAGKGSTSTKAAKAVKAAKDADKAAEAQRKFFAQRAKRNENHTWPLVGSLSNLSDVYNLHCRQNLVSSGVSSFTSMPSTQLEGGNVKTSTFHTNPASLSTAGDIMPPSLDKQLREMFVIGSLDDIADQYQSLCTYCAKDVLATLDVLCRLWPQFQAAFPHPVTTAGMLEMSTTFLPVNINNWHRYIELSDRAFADAELQVQRVLNDAATHAVLKYAGKNSTLNPRDDIWLWDLDWTPATISAASATKAGTLQLPAALLDELPIDYAKGGQVTVPIWYKKLLKDSSGRAAKKTAVVRKGSSESAAETDVVLNLTSRLRIVPKLLKLSWDGWPLHHDIKKGWGYLQPDDQKAPTMRKKIAADAAEQPAEKSTEPQFPLKTLLLHQKAMLNAANAAEISDIQPSNETSATKKKKVGATAVKKVADRNSLDEKLNSYDGASDAERTAIIEAVIAAGKTPQVTPDEISQNDFETDGGGATSVGKPHYDVVPGCVFRRLTHSDGTFGNVGNPLAQEFLEHFQSGRLRSSTATSPELRDAIDKIVRLSKRMSQWLMYKKRVNAQILVEADDLNNSGSDQDAEQNTKWGVILPRVVPMGTVTRRAVEPTWLTALNPKPDRIASELKALVQAPKGYAFVGADVDSQELWIAALYGDARFAGQHGCTALGWMTLQGTKAEGTDMHSRVAQLIGCDRDQAKVLNYARIYGAGQAYVAQMLKKFQPSLTPIQARSRALKLMRSTKGEKVYKLNSFGQAIMRQAQKLQADEKAFFSTATPNEAEIAAADNDAVKTSPKKPRKKTTTSAKSSLLNSLPTAAVDKQWFTQGELMQARALVEKHSRGNASKKSATNSVAKAKKSTSFVPFESAGASSRTFSDMVSDWAWRGGSESSMFNALEAIAKSDEPRTPVLQSAVTRCLQKRHVGEDFFTSRVNWVVQSSAVDYLHLMLVSMRYLCDTAGISSARLALSIHDEVRFLVRDQDKYKAALALQYTNLLTRAMFAHRLGINNLPASVAFFSSVEIDRCIRKQASDNCITPSNVRGMLDEYGIPPGESLTIQELVDKLESTGEGTRLFSSSPSSVIDDNVENGIQDEHVVHEEDAVVPSENDKLEAAAQ